jgi:hypothetical protein
LSAQKLRLQEQMRFATLLGGKVLVEAAPIKPVVD